MKGGKSLTLLIDADVLRYLIAFTNTKSITWDEGEEAVVAIQPEKAKAELEDYVEEMVEKFGATDYVLALSCNDHNFRKDVDPTYKLARHKREKPALWYVLDDHMESTFGDKIVKRYGLEGDDILGLLASHPHPKRAPGDRIVVSIDKDLATIPCRLYNPMKPDIGTRRIGIHDANLFWMKQTLMGDATDNYPGCPGIGGKRADAVLMPIHERYIDAPHEFHLDALWAAVVKTYESKDLTAEDAIRQARLARILRDGDYDYKNQKVNLWTPSS